MEKMLMAIRRDLVYNKNGVEVHGGEAETVVNVDGKEAARIDWNKGRVIRGHVATDKAREVFEAVNEQFKFEQPSYIPCPECDGKGRILGHLCGACNFTGSVEGDPGMRKVVNLVTNYMSALCETGARPGYFDRFTAAGTAWYIPEEGENIFIDSPEDCARILNEYFL